mgnify:CR=1 FL=1
MRSRWACPSANCWPRPKTSTSDTASSGASLSTHLWKRTTPALTTANSAVAAAAQREAVVAALRAAAPMAEDAGVTLLLERVPHRLRGALEWWCLASAFALAVYIAWYSLRLVWVSYSTHDISPAADASPLWIPQIAMALGCIGFALAFGHALALRWRGGSFIAAAGEAAHVE